MQKELAAGKSTTGTGRFLSRVVKAPTDWSLPPDVTSGGGVLGLLVGSILAVVFCGCIVDDSAPCGELFRPADNGGCSCPAKMEPVDGVCIACGEHSSEVNGRCVCEEGYARDSPGDACQELIASGPTNVDLGADGGRAPQCSSSQDCSGDLLCDIHGVKSCVEPPESLGKPCSGNEDCDGVAGYCELFSSGLCAIEGCAQAQGRCPGDMVCCDYQILSRSFCVGAESLEGGECPAPGERVSRVGSGP